MGFAPRARRAIIELMSWDGAPWTRGGLRVTRAAMDEIDRQAVAGYLADHEVCGLLAGPAADALLCDRAILIENMARVMHERDPVKFPESPRTSFAFHERRLEAEMRDGTSRGSPVKVLYHSHLDAPAKLSGTDEAMLSRGQLVRGPGGGSAVRGAGPAWPLAFMVQSVLRPDPSADPVVVDRRLFVWERGEFIETPLDVVDD